MILIVGSGRVGSTIAMILVERELGDVSLIDIIPGLPQGEALDLSHYAAEIGNDAKIAGSNDYASLRGSELVIVTAGLARKPGMTRMDLLTKNASIIGSVSREIAKHAPDAIVIVVTNPMDAMTYVALRATGFPKKRVIGMGGMLDLSRYKEFLATRLGISRASIEGLVVGEHGESMTPLITNTSAFGVPLLRFVSEADAREVTEETRKVAAKVIELKGATFYAPANGVARMVEAIVYDKKALLPLSTYLEGEFGVSGICIGVPAILGRGGVERIVEVDMSPAERESFDKGVATLREALSSLKL
jgi:malate dehydrogenase